MANAIKVVYVRNTPCILKSVTTDPNPDLVDDGAHMGIGGSQAINHEAPKQILTRGHKDDIINVKVMKRLAREKVRGVPGAGGLFSTMPKGSASLASVLEDPKAGPGLKVMTKEGNGDHVVGGILGLADLQGGTHAFVHPLDGPSMRQRDATSKEKRSESDDPVCIERERSLSPGSSTRSN